MMLAVFVLQIVIFYRLNCVVYSLRRELLFQTAPPEFGCSFAWQEVVAIAEVHVFAFLALLFLLRDRPAIVLRNQLHYVKPILIRISRKNG